MDHLLRLLSLDKFRSMPQITQEPRSPASSGLFDKLAIQTIQLIASWLPLSSSVALTLCNHSLRRLIGDQYLLKLRQHRNKEERERFLPALDRDITESYYCFYCNKIHLLSKNPRISLTAQERFRRVAECGRGHNDRSGGGWPVNVQAERFYNEGFRFEHLQMAMKLNRRGLVSDLRAYLDQLSLMKPVCRSMTYGPHCPGFYFLEIRIVHGEAFVRAQEWILIPKSHGISYPDRRIKAVCADLKDGNYRFSDLYHCLINHSDWEQGSCQKPRRCARFPTEIQMEHKCFNNRQRRKMWIITKWMALGPGLSPFDIHWGSRHSQFHRWSCSRDETVPASIRDIFESQPGTKYDSILSMDEAWKALGRKRNR
ncbi:hypothetical protein N7G274_004719 [Stereocaulon virgatum]|uniref:F-box domain-containing protein n=1 Tax=Stereocaulon virgatum TaxID=373712 RepID=A0ABR4ABK2_9LECA